jgi:hypothetical protein
MCRSSQARRPKQPEDIQPSSGDRDHDIRVPELGLGPAPSYPSLFMGKIVGIGFTVVFFACSSSGSKPARDAARSDLPTLPAAAADVAPDPRTGDVANGPDTLARDVAADPVHAAEGGGEAQPNLDLSAVDRGRSDSNDDTYATTDVTNDDATVTSDLAEQCSCGDTQTNAPASVSWGCFCAVEKCTRTLADFVDVGSSDRVFKSSQTARMLVYADCNRILVQDYTYSRNVSVSEYVFDRTTEALIGAKVLLDDRQHTCPFPTSGAHWVFGYQSGDYPIPSNCKLTSCVAGSGTCPP